MTDTKYQLKNIKQQAGAELCQAQRCLVGLKLGLNNVVLNNVLDNVLDNIYV